MSQLSMSQALLTHGTSFPLETSAEDLMLQMVELREAVLVSSWDVVGQDALTLAGLSQTSAQALMIGAFSRRGRMTELIGNVTAALVRRLRDDPDFSDPETALAQLLPNDVSDQAVETLLELFQNPETSVEQLAPEPPLVTDDLSALLPGRAFALSALGHSAFNQDIALGTSNSFFRMDQMIDALQRVVERKQSDLNNAIAMLRDACLRDAGDSQKLNALASAGLLSEEAIVHLAHAESKGLLLFEELINDGKGTKAERVGRILAQANWQTRDWIGFSLAAMRLVPALAFGVGDDQDVDALIAAAQSNMQTFANVPNGLDKELHALGPEDDGRFLELRGQVTQVSSEIDSEDRLIGRVELRDPSSEATATLAVLFVNPANAGIIPGAFVQASGIWRQQLQTIDQSPGLLVDTLAPTELTQSSWSFGLLNLAEAWFPRYRNRKNLIWSRSRHSIGGALDPNAQGAAELIFLRFGAPPPEDN